MPGQPVSWDAAYRSGRMPVRRKGVQVYNPDGTPKMITRPVKTDDAKLWQDAVYQLVITARPSGWRPTGQIRLIVDLILSKDMDDDNAMKLTRDAAAKAIGIDDMQFLSCTRSKTITDDPRLAGVTMTFDDEV